MKKNTIKKVKLELIDPERNHKKFYELGVGNAYRAIQGSFEVVRRWGRIGSQGQMKVEVFSHLPNAIKVYELLLAQKKAKGYLEV